MEFKQFKGYLQSHFQKMIQDKEALFVTATDKHKLWDIYLDSFPYGTNEIFRERREFDCSCCRHFIYLVGNIVKISKDKLRLTSIWDFNAHDPVFQTVINKLSRYVKAQPICDVFVTKEHNFGTDKNHEPLEDSKVRTWEHFYLALPSNYVTVSNKSEAAIAGNLRDIKNVFQRSLTEIHPDAVDSVLDLISQNALYKGEEWSDALAKFSQLQQQFNKLSNNKKENFCWLLSSSVGGAIGKIRNHSMGVLLTDISSGMDLNEAVKRYESIVAPSNYKRPKAIFTKKMIEEAQKTLKGLGLMESLGRRYASIDDIKVNNILFANRNTQKRMNENALESAFEELQQEATVKSIRSFDKSQEVPIDQFVKNILPRLTSIQVLFENRHSPNLVSLIAPKDPKAPSLFKWNNGYSWSYNGNITDSMKQRVKDAGGNVSGVLRFSIQWNENGDNQNDFDAHCIEPNKNHIFFPSRGTKHPSTGMLDVDITHPSKDRIAIENITWTNIDKMQEGRYLFYVHNFCRRGGQSGFSAEIEYNGQIYSFEYNKELRNNEKVVVAEIEFSRKNGINFIQSLDASTSSRSLWNIATNQFHPVSIFMFSPNYWDDKTGIGNKHYFFMINNCTNSDRPNGFFNEFLREDLIQHKRVFEALGSKMRVDTNENQLSGLGFSSTQRNSLVCKIEGHASRMIKITF
jgi:hypothetical protein